MFVRWFRFCFSNLTLIPLRWLNKCYSLVSTPRWAPLYFHHPPCLFLITRGIKTKKSFIFIIAIVKQTSSKWKYTDWRRDQMYHWYLSTVVPPRRHPLNQLPSSTFQSPSPDWLEFKFRLRDSKSRVVEKLCLSRHVLRSVNFNSKSVIFVKIQPLSFRNRSFAKSYIFEFKWTFS